MSNEDEIQVKVEEPAPVEEEPSTERGGADAAVDALKSGGNPIDAMDGFTLLVALLVTSIIVFVSSCVAAWAPATPVLGGVSGYVWWAFVGSLLSIVACVILIVFKKCCEPQFVTAGPWMMIVLLVLWLAVMFPATFASPFTALSNGWIGCWASVVVSAALAARAFADKAKAMQNAIASQTGSEATKFALFLGMSSLVVLIAASVGFGVGGCGGGLLGTGTGYLGYAVALAVISILAVVVVLIIANVESMKQHSNKTNMIISIFLIVWWAVGAFVTTFVAPFGGTACSLNGYLAVWISIYASFSLFKACGLATVQQWFNKNKSGGAGDGGESAADDTPAL
jgi:hypothetical protein